MSATWVYPSAVDEADLPIVVRYERDEWHAYVLRRDDDTCAWELQWSDGINVWHEEFHEPWHAFARLTALVAAVEQDVFMVHDWTNRGTSERVRFLDEAERFVSRTVHASSCARWCDGTDPVNHQV